MHILGVFKKHLWLFLNIVLVIWHPLMLLKYDKVCERVEVDYRLYMIGSWITKVILV